MTTCVICNVPRSMFSAKANASGHFELYNLRDKVEDFINASLPISVACEVISYDDKGARMSVQSKEPFSTYDLEKILLKGAKKGFQNPSQSSLF